MRKFLAAGLRILFLCGIFIPGSAEGGAFSAVPVKVFFEKKTRSAVLKVVNTGEEKLTLQLRAVLWHQDENGVDRYEPTDDILFFPRMAHVEPGKTQVIRLGYEGPPPGNVERTYRLYLEELPVSKPGELAVKIAIRMGVPIFIKADGETRLWTIERFDLVDGTLAAWVRNGGSGHIVVTSLNTTAFDDSGAEAFSRKVAGWYVLPGVSKKHVLRISREECLKASTLKLAVEIDGAVAAANLNVDRKMCPKEDEAPPDPGPPRIPDTGADGG